METSVKVELSTENKERGVLLEELRETASKDDNKNPRDWVDRWQKRTI